LIFSEIKSAFSFEVGIDILKTSIWIRLKRMKYS